MASLNLTQHAIEQYMAALRAKHYRVRLVNFQTDQAKPVIYSAQQLIDPKTVAFLRWQNSLGFDVYARPMGWQYVLLDDLTRQDLALIKADELRPCLLLETSPANYQAWVILADCPTDRQQAKDICRDMAHRYGADLCSAEPDHLGRLPGLTNRKAKYQLDNGQYPFVRLHRATHRLSTFFTPVGGCVVSKPVSPSQDTVPGVSSLAPANWDSVHGAVAAKSGTGGSVSPDWDSVPIGANTVPNPTGTVFQAVQQVDRQARTSRDSHSEHDFGIVVGLIKKGWADERIRAHLLAHSPDLLKRKGRYVEKYMARTIREARRRVG